MEKHRTAGGIVLGDSGTIALVWSENSQAWLFPKGKIEGGESDEDAARREVAEETGLTNLEYLDDLGSFERPNYTVHDGTEREGKSIHLFLFAAEPHAELSPTLEIQQAKWVPFREVPEVLGSGEHPEWFTVDRAWYSTVAERVRQAIQRD